MHQRENELTYRKLALVAIIPNSLLFQLRQRQKNWQPDQVGQHCVFSSDLAVSSSIFVGAEREENWVDMYLEPRLIWAYHES